MLGCSTNSTISVCRGASHGSGTTATGTLALTLTRTDVYRGDSPGYPRPWAHGPDSHGKAAVLHAPPVHAEDRLVRVCLAASLEAATKGQSSHP